MNQVEGLIHKRKKHKNKFLIHWYTKRIRRYGLDVHPEVKIGKNVRFLHDGLGTVIHKTSIIDDNVMIMQNVTLGRSDIWVDYDKAKMKGIHVKKGAVICTGAKVLCKNGVLTVGENTIIAANAVLTKSTGDNEVWAGVPARKIKDRDDIQVATEK